MRSTPALHSRSCRLRGIVPAVLLWLAASGPALAHLGESGGTAHAGAWWTAWNDDLWLWLLMGASAALYAIGIRRLWSTAGAGRGIARWRALAFAGGWVASFLALLSPLDPLGARLFWVHMVQHEILVLVAAPLLALGRPLAAFVWGLPRSWRRPAWLVVHRGGLQAAVRWLSRPGVAWGVHAIALWIWHAPPLFDRAVREEPLHVAQHLSFFLSALLFWWSLVRPGLRPEAMGLATLSIVTTAMHTGLLGALLTFSPSVWYPVYLETAPLLGWSALDDQHLGGLIMWVPAGLVYLGLALLAFSAWLSSAAPGAAHSRPAA